MRSSRHERPVLGVLMLDGPYLTVPGALAHPATFEADVLYRVVPGALGLRVVGPDHAELTGAYGQMAEQLRSEGATILTANCGFAVSYTEEVRNRSGLPTVLSSLPLLPLLRHMHGERVGVLTFDATQLDRDRMRASSWAADWSVPVADVQSSDPWLSLSFVTPTGADLQAMARDLMAVASDFAAREGLSALLLECTGMCPFTQKIAQATGLPTYSIVDSVRLALSALPQAAGNVATHQGGARA
jgi:hypothetical protein